MAQKIREFGVIYFPLTLSLLEEDFFFFFFATSYDHDLALNMLAQKCQGTLMEHQKTFFLKAKLCVFRRPADKRLCSVCLSAAVSNHTAGNEKRDEQQPITLRGNY